MAYYPSLPWPEIHEFLLHIEQAEDAKTLCLQTTTELNLLIPYDSVWVLFLDEQFQVHDHLIHGVSEKLVRDYLNYYIFVDPCREKTPQGAKAWRLNWNEFKDTEFQTDFGWNADIFHSASMYLHNPKGGPGAALFTIRSGAKGFSDREFAIWEVIQSHLSNHFSITEKLKLFNHPPADVLKGDLTSSGLALNPREFHPVELIQGHKLLSKREAEVTALLCQRLTVPEIATKLVISPHTVRTYIENIKEKLNVKNRRELIIKLSDLR